MDVKLESRTTQEFAVIRSSSCSINVQDGAFESCRSDLTSETSTYARRDLSIVVEKAKHSRDASPDSGRTHSQPQHRNAQNRRDEFVRPTRSYRGMDANRRIVRNLPADVMSLIDSPYSKITSPESVRCSQTRTGNLWFLNISLKILRELQAESNNLIRLESEGISLTREASSPLLVLIKECFLENVDTEADGSRYSQREINKLVIECLQILEKSIYKQAITMKNLAEENPNVSEARIAKKMLKCIMRDVQNELNNSKTILEIVNSDIHCQAFKFIFGLLKHFVEKSAALLRVGSFIAIKSSDHIGPGGYLNKDANSTLFVDDRLEEFTERLDRLLEKWGDGKHSMRQPESGCVIIDCYHCHTKCKKQEMLLKTVSQFTEEMKNELITHVKSYRQENLNKPPIKATNSSNDTIRSEDMSTLDSSKNHCQKQNFPQPKCLPAVPQFRQQSYFGRNPSFRQLIHHPNFHKMKRNEVHQNKAFPKKYYQGLQSVRNKEEEPLQKTSPNGRYGSANNNCAKCLRKTSCSERNSLDQKRSPPPSRDRGDFGGKAFSYNPPQIWESYAVQPVYGEREGKKANSSSPEEFDFGSKRKISVLYEPALPADQVEEDQSDLTNRALSKRRMSKTEAKRRASTIDPGTSTRDITNKSSRKILNDEPEDEAEGNKIKPRKSIAEPENGKRKSISAAPAEVSEDTERTRDLLKGRSSKRIQLEKIDETAEGQGEPNSLATPSSKGRRKSQAENARRASTIKKRVSVKPEPIAAYSDTSHRSIEPDVTLQKEQSRDNPQTEDKVVAQKSVVKEIVIQERVDPKIVEYLLGKDAQGPTTSPKPIPATDSVDCNKKPPKESKPEHCCRLTCKCSNKKQAEQRKKNCCRGACTCAPTKNVGVAPVMFTPCHCNQAGPQNVGDLSSRPIYQFFTNPMPISCPCPGNPAAERETGVCGDLSTGTSDPCTQDVETQTSKKGLAKSTECSSTGVSTKTLSRTDKSSSSCNCTPSSSEGCTKGKEDGACMCPEKIEEMFQDFDEKYSRVIRELKCLIKEGYIPLSNSDEPCSQPKEPSYCKPPQVEVRPCMCKKQRDYCEEISREFESKSNIRRQSTTQFVDPMYQDLRREIESLRQMVKNTNFEQCSCCKCCKCGINGENSHKAQMQPICDDKPSYQAKKVYEKPPSRDDVPSHQAKKVIEKAPSNGEEPSYQAKSGHQKPQISDEDPSSYQAREGYEKMPSCDSIIDLPVNASVIQASPSQVKLESEEKLPITVQKFVSPKQTTPKRVSPTANPNGIPPKWESQDPMYTGKTTKISDINKPETRRSLMFQEPQEDLRPVVNQGNGAADGSVYEGLELGPATKFDSAYQQPTTQKVDPSQKSGSASSPGSLGQLTQSTGNSQSPGNAGSPASSGELKQSSGNSQSTRHSIGISQMTPLQQASTSDQQQNARASIALPKVASSQQATSRQQNGRTSSISVPKMTSPQQATSIQQNGRTRAISVSKLASPQPGIEHRPSTSGSQISPLQAGSAEADQSTTEAQFIASTQGVGSQQLPADSKSPGNPNTQEQPMFEGSYEGRPMPKHRGRNAFDAGEGAEYRALYASRENLFDSKTKDKKPLEPSSDEEEGIQEGEEPYELPGRPWGGRDDKAGQPHHDREGKQEGTLGRDDRPDGRHGQDGQPEGPHVPDGKPEGQRGSEGKPGGSHGQDAKTVGGDKDQNQSKQDHADSRGEDQHKERVDQYDEECPSCEGECTSDSETDSVRSAIDKCQAILDTMPCNFFSDSSSTESSVGEVANVNNGGNELYVMIIQPQVDPSTEDIVKTIVVSNNAKKPSSSIIATSTDDNRKNKNINHSSDQRNSYCEKKIREVSWKGTESQHRIIQQLCSKPFNSVPTAKEATFSTSIVGEDKDIKPNNKRRLKNLSYSVKVDSLRPAIRKTREMSRKSRERRRSGGDLKSRESLKTSEKEVQVTKWNAKVQTAGPRKFNRTDISKEVEDRLAKYLGLERTIEETKSMETPSPSTEMVDTKKRSSVPDSRVSKKKVTTKSRK